MPAARFAALALAFGLAPGFVPGLVTIPTRPAAPLAGPPLLCFPLDVGGAVTLPFGGDGFDVKSDLSTEEVVAQTRALLDKSDDALVHMETLRRVTIWFMNRDPGARAKKGEAASATTFRAQLVESLLVAASSAETVAAQQRHEALRWFDLGYFQAAARQSGELESTHERDWLEKSLRLAPDDLVMRFGVALAEYYPGDDASRTAWAGHMMKVFEAKAPPELVKKNAVATLGAFLDARDWEKLGAEVRKRLGRA